MSRQPPAATDPATATYTYEIRFVPATATTTGLEADTDVDAETVTIVTGSTDRDSVKETAYTRLQHDHGFESREAVEQAYTIDCCRVGFHDEPWDDGADLEAALTELDGVRDLRYISPFEGNYGPPRYWLRVDAGDEAAVREAVTEYYPGLQVREDDGGGGVVVVVSALANVE